MRFEVRSILTMALSAICLAVFPVAASAQDEEPKTGWFDTAELTYVLTSGNAETSTLGFKNDLVRLWKDAEFSLKVGAIRAESTTVARRVVGTPDNFTLIEDETTETTAENYFLRARYARDITDTLFWYVGGGWERDRFAGIDNRYSTGAGIGLTHFDEDARRFKTTYGVTFTRQEDLSGFEDEFAGLQFTWLYFRQFNETTEYGNDLVLDYNLDETDDWRGDMTNWLAVNMTDRLALKLSLQLKYDNLPSAQLVALESALPQFVGVEVPVPLDELDSIFSVAMVINF